MALARLSYDPWEETTEERKATFVGRKTLFDRLCSAIQEQEHRETIQHYLIRGPRGIGKTTLLLALRDRIREDPEFSKKWFCVQLREEEFYAYTIRDLIALLLEGLIDDQHLSEMQKAYQAMQEEKDEAKSLAVGLDGLRTLAGRSGKKILFLIDNFDRVFPKTLTGSRKKISSDVHYRTFRKLLSTENFLMIIGGSVKMLEEIAAYDDAFFNFFCPVDVPPLSHDEIMELLCKRAEAEGDDHFLRKIRSMVDTIQAVTFMTGGNPRLVRMLYDVLNQRDMMNVVRTLRETIGGLTPLLKDELEKMPRQQSKTLDALMRLDGVASPSRIARYARLPLNVVTTQLGRLKESAFIESDGKGRGKPATYQIADPMFRIWYQMRYLRPERRRIEIFVEFLKAWFSLEERSKFLQQQWERFKKFKGKGLKGRAKEILFNIEYYVASLDDQSTRETQLEQTYDAYLTVGAFSEAAQVVAELQGINFRSKIQYETAGYAALGRRLETKGDLQQAIKIYSQGLKKDENNLDLRLSLGVCLGLSGNHTAAITQFNNVLAAYPPVEQKAKALFNRGVAYSLLHPPQVEKAISDYTAVIEMEGAPAELKAQALYSRGIEYGRLDPPQMEKEIADYTAVTEMEGAPAEYKADALINRGAAYGVKGNYGRALMDFQAALAIPEISKEQFYRAIQNQGIANLKLGNQEEALSDFARCAESGFSGEVVYRGLTPIIGFLSQTGKLDEATQWVARVNRLEPESIPLQDRLQFRLGLILSIVHLQSPATAERFLQVLLKSDPAELRKRLGFLAPALELARTGDETVLGKLPREEQAIARHIADSFSQGAEGRGA